MKKIKLFFVGLVFVFGLNHSNAQLSIGADLSGIRSMTDGAEFMFGGMINARYGITDNIQLGLNLGFYQKSLGEIFGQSLKSRIIPITLSGEYFLLTDNARPYVGLDLGLYTFGAKFESSSSSESRFGLAPVAGFQYGINDNLYLNTNIKYHLILESNTDGLFSFNIGIGYRL